MSTISSKQAILVVSFGTSHPDTCNKNIGAIERAIADAFPQWEVRRAFTSGMILRKLRTRDGVIIPTVAEALTRLEQEGFDRVICQPTHIINGEEFDGIVADMAPFRDRFATLALGKPLLTATEDYQAVAGIISRNFARLPDHALCLMGHGTSHYADAAYAALDYHFQHLGRPDIVVGTVEGFPDLAAVRQRIAATGATQVTLTPLMVVAGDHAANDMASDDADSWKSVLEADGYTVDCILRGLGEYGEIRQRYVLHVGEAMDELGEK